MRSSSVRSIAVAPMLCALSALIATPSAADENGVTWRPIEEWVAAQGTYCIKNPDGSCQQWLTGIDRNFPAITSQDGCRCVMIDYAGIIAQWLDTKSGGAIRVPTKITGTVQEKPVDVERMGTIYHAADVKVDLMVRDAITWVFEDCFFSAPAVYGSRYDEILTGARPVLSDVHIQLNFTNSAPGAPLPDLVMLMVGANEVISLDGMHTTANGEGFFRSAYGVPDGTPGRMHVTSNLLYNNLKKNVYGTPVSNIKLEQVQGKSQ